MIGVLTAKMLAKRSYDAINRGDVGSGDSRQIGAKTQPSHIPATYLSAVRGSEHRPSNHDFAISKKRSQPGRSGLVASPSGTFSTSLETI
jgi:hypothetical protein